MRKVTLAAVMFAVCLWASAQAFEVPDTNGTSWYKGNTHTHSTRSVGASSALGLATWYRRNGYQFLALTDDAYPPDPAFVSQVSDPAFLLLPGMEVKASARTSWVHVNGLNATEAVRAVDDSSILTTLQGNIDAVRKAGGIPQIDHPQYNGGPDGATILASEGCSLMEIYNGVAGPALPRAEADHDLSTEIEWDWLLSRGKRIYGVASDDAQAQPGAAGTAPTRPGQPGRGWVVVRARALDAAEILRALERGSFYASTGVELMEVSVEPQRISIAIKAVAGLTYSTTFVGDGGRVLLTTTQNPAVFDLAEPLSYVRAKVTDSALKCAWIQPVFVETGGQPNSAP